MKLLGLAPNNIDSIIFDVDGVLIDVRPSYHKAIQETFRFYTNKNLGQEDLFFIKKQAGINNDWEGTMTLILIDIGYIKKEEALDYTKNQNTLQQKLFNNPYIDYQELIERFETFYKTFREHEKLLIEKDFLKKIKDLYKTGIVTGRPKEDLMFSLKVFDIEKYFDFIVDDDFTEDKTKRKPSKEALRFCIEGLASQKGAIYLGDTISDFMMVNHYNESYKPYVYYIHCDFYKNDTNLLKDDNIKIVKRQKQLEDIIILTD